jgi:AraC-like DNA-binding protein
MENDNELFSLKQVSDQVGCSKALVQKMVNEGEITPKWFGGLQVITRKDMEKVRTRYERNKREG